MRRGVRTSGAKGVSPTISYVLLLALMVILSVSAYFWGTWQINRLQDEPIVHNIEAQMISIDSLVQSVAHGDTNFTTIMMLYYPKGVMQVHGDGSNNHWITWTAQVNTKAYEDEITGAPCAYADYCKESCTVIIDNNLTGLKLARIPYTNVYRGTTGGDEAQYVQILSCWSNVQIETDDDCVGKSGPRAKMTLRKIGYNATTKKPIVKVRIC